MLKTLTNMLYSVDMKGLDKLDLSKPGIIIPNHISLADPAVLAAYLPRDVWFVANTDIAKKYAALMKGRNILTVDPLNPYAIKQMIKLLKEGKTIVIFPEGRITVTGSLMKIFPGTGYIALKTGANVYPVTITGLERSTFSYLKGKIKRKINPKVRVSIGDPFTITQQEHVPMKEQKKAAADLILHKLQEGRFHIQQKENVNLFNELMDAAAMHGMNTPISEDKNGTARYKDLLLKAYVLSETYRPFVENQQRVGVLLPNVNAHVVTLFSLFYLGKTPAVLNFSFGEQTMRENCETADLQTVITSKEFIQQGRLEHLIAAFEKQGVRVLYLDNVMPLECDSHLLSFLSNQPTVGLYMPDSVLRYQYMKLLQEINKSFIILEKWDSTIKMPVLTTDSMVRRSQINVSSTVFVVEEKKAKGTLQPMLTESTGNVKARSYRFHTISSSNKIKGALAFRRKKRASSRDNELVLFTSGSEATPKGVVLSHDNLHANIYQARSIIDFTGEDKIFNALPMFHSFGLTAGTFLPLLLGIPVFLFPSPIQYKNIREVSYLSNATIIFGTSTFLAGYANGAHPLDFERIRYAFAGAEKLRPEVRDTWAREFGVRIFEGYGITETSPILSLNTPLEHKENSVGRPLPGIQWKVEPVEGIEKGGKLFVKGPNVMKGYLLHGQGFVPHTGWYDTGDVVEIDDNDFITITARMKRFAKLGGEMISLNLVEQLAFACFSDGEFGAVNIPDARKGEKIILFTTSEGATKDALRQYLTTNGHSALLMPAEIRYVQELPMLGSGKSNYVRLKEMAEK